MQFKIIYEDENVLVVDKPAGIVVFPENQSQKEKTLIDCLLDKFPYLKNGGNPPRYGVVHRLDKDTSGILLIAKDSKTLGFLQKQFKEGRVEKKYLALVVGNVKNEKDIIETLIGRSPKDRKKQRVYLSYEPGSIGKRRAVTEYRVIEIFPKFTLVEATPKTGRKHQIRTHLAYLGNPIAGDKLYGFKNQSCPKDLVRHFLHAAYLKITLPDAGMKEFHSDLPEDLKKILKTLRITNV